jgi:hypothetical protein
MRLFPLLALSLTVLAGCKAVDAMDNTETMKSDLAAMKQTTGGMSDTTHQLDNNMLELKRLATIADGKAELVKSENTRAYAPPSINLVVGAKEIAENMHSDELIQFLDGKLKELRESTPKDSEYNASLLGNYSPSYVLEFNLQQQVRIIALQAIAGQIPQAMVEQLINEQIYGGGGRYIDSMNTTLMLRAMFIDSFFLDKGVFNTATPWSAIGELRDASEKTANLDFVASLPFAANISFVMPGTGFLPVINAPELHAVAGISDEAKAAQANYIAKCVTQVPADAACFATVGDAPSFNVQLDPGMAKHWWKKIAQNIKKLPDSLKGSNSPYAREVAQLLEDAQRKSAR